MDSSRQAKRRLREVINIIKLRLEGMEDELKKSRTDSMSYASMREVSDLILDVQEASKKLELRAQEVFAPLRLQD